ncbi:MAG TPA: FAD-dependent monooxygenase [Amycolatopsis sp.]|uniref:FAD-dependent monooxygenase n=1 Tax=Amycolatopsis sp. TaxID=37632 RepID=UPI002B4638C2|nr:FAD-dependent monooxygenase [Amycolatopsis sp.]HKS48000.1 FAD-dependent monooxygenase [Amycolatopsis sp.]
MIEVLVVGAGPAGLLLACELRLAGVETVLLERDPEPPGFCRGFNLNARALDLLACRGLAKGFVSEGRQVPHAAFSGLPVTLNLPGARTSHPYSLGIPQTWVQEVLEEHAVKLGAEIRRGHRLDAFEQDSDEVTAIVSDGDTEYRIRALWLVGCDGGRSTVRKIAGIDFPGTKATRFSLLGDVELADPADLPFGVTSGVVVIPRPGYVRIITEDPRPPADKDTPVTLEILRNAVDTALGRHVELHSPRWLTRFGNAARQAVTYVKGRVMLAGDAAHIHPPAGAIGVNVALDDAFNLGWKLAATVRGTASPHLLDSYQTERHAAGARVLANAQAQVLLGETDDRLADFLTRVAAHPDGNRAFAEVVTGLDTHYEMHSNSSHPWLGRLAPDLDLVTDAGSVRLTALLAAGRGVLLDLAGSVGESAKEWADRVEIVRARSPDQPELRAFLVRPDGHVAWLQAGDGPPDGLSDALRHWYGPWDGSCEGDDSGGS